MAACFRSHRHDSEIAALKTQAYGHLETVDGIYLRQQPVLYRSGQYAPPL